MNSIYKLTKSRNYVSIIRPGIFEVTPGGEVYFRRYDNIIQIWEFFVSYTVKLGVTIITWPSHIYNYRQGSVPNRRPSFRSGVRLCSCRILLTRDQGRREFNPYYTQTPKPYYKKDKYQHAILMTSKSGYPYEIPFIEIADAGEFLSISAEFGDMVGMDEYPRNRRPSVARYCI